MDGAMDGATFQVGDRVRIVASGEEAEVRDVTSAGLFLCKLALSGNFVKRAADEIEYSDVDDYDEELPMLEDIRPGTEVQANITRVGNHCGIAFVQCGSEQTIAEWHVLGFRAYS